MYLFDKHIPKDIFIKIFSDHFNFKEIIFFRLINKSMCKILENKYIWEIINLTDVGTVHKNEISLNLRDNNSYIYFLSGKKREDCFFSIPTSLKRKMIDTKLLII